jgi:hypothetical protein
MQTRAGSDSNSDEENRPLLPPYPRENGSWPRTPNNNVAAIEEANFTKTLLGSAIIGGAAGYFIGKALASTIVAGGSASLFIAFCTFVGAGLLVFVAYYMMGGRSDCCSGFFHQRSSLSSIASSPYISLGHFVQPRSS